MTPPRDSADRNGKAFIEMPASDVVIVGAGGAGLFAALQLAPLRVTVLSETAFDGACASAWAQGGIAAAVDADDTTARHAADTRKAGAGITDGAIADLLTREAPAYVTKLAEMGVAFARDENGHYVLSREACHDTRRVLRATAGDGFGAEMMRALREEVAKAAHINVVSFVSAERILRTGGMTMGDICGISARDVSNGAGGDVLAFPAGAVLLATGGAGGLYAYTTNPLQARARGIAMAARAGAVVSDLEFVQFHPTALDIGEDPCPLATEALRGEGAKLVNSRGQRFMVDYHPMAELAPRDVVSRGIFAQIADGKKAYLDCRAIDTSHFPALRTACARAKIDPQHDLVPVQPAVHYHMGGVATDDVGRTSIDGLWAAGEVAATGLHGANRLASNSLMEAVVMGGRAADNIKIRLAAKPAAQQRILSVPLTVESVHMDEARATIRQIMTDYVGVLREAGKMKKAIRLLREIEMAVAAVDTRTADMALVARMIAVCAYQRKESRGGHARTDYTDTRAEWQHRTFTSLKEIDLIAAGIVGDAVPVAAPVREAAMAG